MNDNAMNQSGRNNLQAGRDINIYINSSSEDIQIYELPKQQTTQDIGRISIFCHYTTDMINEYKKIKNIISTLNNDKHSFMIQEADNPEYVDLLFILIGIDNINEIKKNYLHAYNNYRERKKPQIFFYFKQKISTIIEETKQLLEIQEFEKIIENECIKKSFEEKDDFSAIFLSKLFEYVNKKGV